ncbi:MAG: hypothetical protein WKF35_07175 [Ferruginibacter sp.]
MTIAIHISNEGDENISDSFIYNCFTRLAAEQPLYNFLFIYDSPVPVKEVPLNCTTVHLLPQIKNNLTRYYWYSYKLPALLERFNASVFIFSGRLCSFRTKVPQCMLVDSTSLLQLSQGRFGRKFLARSLEIVKAVCVMNKGIEEELHKTFQFERSKINIILPGLDEIYQPIKWEQSEEIKEKYTSGKDFFYHEVNPVETNITVSILKSFTLFKKWQRSEMQLVLLFSNVIEPAFSKLLASYKYKNDVIILEGIEHRPEILPAAYAALLGINNYYSCLQTMKCAVPLIQIIRMHSQADLSDAAIYSNAEENEISENLMKLYKNEHLRNEYIKRGLTFSAQYSWQNSTSSMWKLINAIADQ